MLRYVGRHGGLPLVVGGAEREADQAEDRTVVLKHLLGQQPGALIAGLDPVWSVAVDVVRARREQIGQLDPHVLRWIKLPHTRRPTVRRTHVRHHDSRGASPQCRASMVTAGDRAMRSW